jgi:Leucine-rich repeat (LRR) protein
MAKRHVSSAKRKAPRARGQAVRAQLGTAQRRIAKAITTSATELDLSDLHQLSDLPEAISKLSFLQSLMLDETSVSDLAVLKPLKGLRNLSIDKTNVSDLGPLRNLTALREFSADHTQVSDLTPISGLSALERLSISHAPVLDLAPIQGLRLLRTLSLNSIPATDFSPIEKLSGLLTLQLNNTSLGALQFASLTEVPLAFSLTSSRMSAATSGWRGKNVCG